MAEKQWYFKFDPTTKEFIPGAVYSEEQPENTTLVGPSGIMNPVWNPSTNTWTGQTVEEFVKEQQSKYQPNPDPVQKQISGLTQMMIAQQAELAMLKAQQKNVTTTTATAQPSQTASQTTSQSASQSTTQSASESTSQSTSAVAGGTTNV